MMHGEFQENEERETAKELLQFLDNARKQPWIETVESIHMKQSSRKMWAVT